MNLIKFKTEKTVGRENLIYRTCEYKYSFKIFWTLSSFARDIYNGTTTLKEADNVRSSLLVVIMNSMSKIKPQNPEKKRKGKRYS